MKKLVFPITLMMIAALLLSACAGGTGGAVTPGADTGTGETPAVEATGGVTPVATTEATAAEATAAETTEAEATAEGTAEGTADATEAATAEATEGATAEATGTAEATPGTGAGGDTTATVEATPAAGTGGTGGTTGGTTAEGQFVRLSTLLSAKVSTNDNSPAGEVDGILVEHPTPPPAEEEGEAAAEGTATPEATATEVVADEEPQEFTVRYILVDTAAGVDTTGGSGSSSTNRGGNIAVIPWQAFDMANATGDTLTINAAGDALTSAPRVSLTDVASGGGAWTEEVATFWTDQGVAGIPATGDTGVNTENLALIPREYRGITIADQEGSEIGNVADFIIDPATGVVIHAVFEGGETFGNRTFAVPMNHLTWSGNSGTQLGSFQFNFPNDALDTAPFFDTLDGIDLGQDWNEQMNEFWNNIQGGGSGTSQ